MIFLTSLHKWVGPPVIDVNIFAWKWDFGGKKVARKGVHIMRNRKGMSCQGMGIRKRWRGGGLKGKEGVLERGGRSFRRKREVLRFYRGTWREKERKERERREEKGELKLESHISWEGRRNHCIQQLIQIKTNL